MEVEASWVVTELDDGKRQNVPDLLLAFKKKALLLECKTCTKSPALISKDEAFAVLQKATDFDAAIRRVSLGKPDFDEHSKLKAQSSTDITLVQHAVFMEAVLRVHAGSISPEQFIEWLSKPGVAEVQRLPGKATHVLPPIA